MKIETKFDIDEEAYFFDGNTAKRERINRIAIECNNLDEITEAYELENTGNMLFPKHQLFKTTKELYKHVEKEIKKLLKNQE